MAEADLVQPVETLSPKDARLAGLKKVATKEYMYDHARDAIPSLFEEVNGATEDFVAGKMDKLEFALFSSQAATLIDKTCNFLVEWKKEYEEKVGPVRNLARENRERAVSLTISPTEKA